MSTTTHDLQPVTVAIDDIAFDRYHYDEVADTLCFHAGPAAWATDFGETAEEHLMRFDRHGRLLSLTILNAGWHLERDGAIDVTLHDGGLTTRLPCEVVEPLLVETPLATPDRSTETPPVPSSPRQPRRARASRSARAPSAGR